ISNIKSIQYKLSDFGAKVPDFKEAVKNSFNHLNKFKTDINIHIPEPYHFEFNNRICPHCGEDSLNKKKFVTKDVILDKIGEVKFYLKQYYCKECHTYHKVKLKHIIKDYEKISKPFKDKLIRKSKTGRKSLRKTSEDYKEDDISISHQSIHNILNIGDKNELTFKTLDLTGYFEFDEQHLTMQKNKKFKGQLIDSTTNQTISIKIHDKTNSKNVKKFLQKNIPENKRKCITTDHHPAYTAPIKNLGFEKHQLCVFHFEKIVDDKINEHFKKNKYTKKEKKKIKKYGWKLKNLFISKDLKDFINKLNKI
ncbi:MAG: hypothetical protein LBU40_00155, partial [Methanobrevibacter sp.]|nr:hypothetical protein [Methanobrevibacter sp.]